MQVFGRQETGENFVTSLTGLTGGMGARATKPGLDVTFYPAGLGTIPVEAIRPDFDLVYYLEAVDEGGTGCFFPDWTKTAPYIIVQTESR